MVELDSANWARRFLGRLDRAATHNRENRPHPLVSAERRRLIDRFADAPRRRLFLDYDGTLREIAQRPEQAAPTPQVLDLLRRLGDFAHTDLHLVSGRRRTTMAAWFADMPVHLCAEHGFAQRHPGGDWQVADVDLSWLPRVQELLTLVCEEVPGSFLERKGGGLAWHYRLADPGYGPWRARELRKTLDGMLANDRAETLAGHAVVEVRAKGIDKGTYAAAQLRDLAPGEFVFCAGDDRTDIDMYACMPLDAFVANVGRPAEGARHVLPSPADLRQLLGQLLGD
ncbi:MAG: trehalose-phosphatase [Planctomycetes bacterium]|nr:trehalose-phosphatase [Planctomycetota bacterium]